MSGQEARLVQSNLVMAIVIERLTAYAHTPYWPLCVRASSTHYEARPQVHANEGKQKIDLRAKGTREALAVSSQSVHARRATERPVSCLSIDRENGLSEEEMWTGSDAE